MGLPPRKPILTIAIPTYSRGRELLPRLKAALSNGIAEVADLLVLDDGSQDDTVEALTHADVLEQIRLVSSPTNRGYARTFVDAMRQSRTDFMLMSADDDDLLPDGVRALARALVHETAHLITTVYLREGGDERGRTRRGRIVPRALRVALNLAPGNVYRVATAKAYLTNLERRLEVGCSMAHLYPQVVLGTHIALHHEVRWSPVATVSEGANLPTGIRDASGRAYDSAASRMQQIADYDALLLEILESVDDAGARGYALGLHRHHRRTAFGQLRHWIEETSPDLARAMGVGGVRSLGLRPLRAVRAWWRRRR